VLAINRLKVTIFDNVKIIVLNTYSRVVGSGVAVPQSRSLYFG